ncbi:hypothetical protein LCGC14_1309670 [marine sediment metagenome]|uniref:Peptidase M15A C-terminal domain-containing protein n=1 Tax=marine sediment metagenome TaxID=412755 RepID=A0A0F9L7P6_9ZZZZ
MKLADFDSILHFEPKEISGWENMEAETVKRLDTMRHLDGEALGFYFLVTSAYREARPGEGFSYHHHGRAIDGVMICKTTREPLPLIHQYMIASRHGWGGIGLYPHWNRPGLHLDTRIHLPYERHARWWRDERGKYRDFYEFMERTELWGLNTLT